MNAAETAHDRFLHLVRAALSENRGEKIVLGKPCGTDATVKKLTVRPVTLRAGPRLSFVWNHQTRDITKNYPIEAGLQEIDRLLGKEFLDGHLLASDQRVQYSSNPSGSKLHVEARATPKESPSAEHDRTKARAIAAHKKWLLDLGVTNEAGRPREGMAPKFRQIQKFAEILRELLSVTFPASSRVRVVDMGSGKGYLTFALAEMLGERGDIVGVEGRPELVAAGNRIAGQNGFADNLRFVPGKITEFPVETLEVLIALHACDTATDDALAYGVAAGAGLLVVSPCCHKEIRPQLVAPAVLAPAWRHGIFQERQAEFVTDALRAGLLEWAGYRTKVFEFVSPEHTARNLMITAVKERAPGTVDDVQAQQVRSLAKFYGIRTQALARALGIALESPG